MKVWVYQKLLLAMIGWPLMIYEIPLSWVESVETYLNGYLCKWLGVSKNISILFLYYDETCPLLIHGLVTEFNKCKVGGLLKFQQSEDQSVRDNIKELYIGKKWKVEVKASNIDSRIKIFKLMGNTQVGWTELGDIKHRKRFIDGKQQSRREFQELIKKGESASLYTKTVEQSVQG